MIKLLTLGDVVGKAGTELLCGGGLQKLRARYTPDLVIVNGENAAEGNGLSRETAMRLYDAGADVLTLGNHTFGRREICPYLDDCAYILRPANMAPRLPGRGWGVFEGPRGVRICVMNLMGRCELDSNLETKVANMFAVGDGAGITRGLSQASASGVWAARVIGARACGQKN